MKKLILVVILLLLFSKQTVFAKDTSQLQTPKQDFFKGRIIEIVKQGEKKIQGYKTYYQVLRVKIDDGSKNGKFTVIENGTQTKITKDQLLTKDQKIVVAKTIYSNNQTVYSIYDAYRLSNMLIFFVIFFIVIVVIAGLKGIGSILGMLISLSTILLFIVPNILSGKDPLTITLIGSVFILFTTTYLAHGISKKTTIALLSTLISLFLTAGFAIFAINLNHITGLGNEDLFMLQIGPTSIIDIKGLFLSGIIITTLGALNDITTSQSTAVFELKQLEPRLKFLSLFEKGFSIGKEHIASLINTLILAYAGSAFAVFIFFVLNPSHLPYWVIINNEVVADEVIKIIAGSMGLLLSVPIVTLIAAYFFSQKNLKN